MWNEEVRRERLPGHGTPKFALIRSGQLKLAAALLK